MKPLTIALVATLALACGCRRDGDARRGDPAVHIGPDSGAEADVDADADADPDAGSDSGGGEDADAEADQGPSSAPSRLLEVLGSRDGGIDPSLRSVITNIDAVGSPVRDAGGFRIAGTFSRLPGGEVRIARLGQPGVDAGPAGAVSPVAGLGSIEGGSRRSRLHVSRRSSLMRISGGRVDRTEVLRVVDGRMGAITRCYEQRLAADGSLSGRVVFGWTVAEGGRVSRVAVESSTLPDPAVGDCVVRVIRGLRFPPPEGGPVTITLPFLFRPDSL